MKLYHGTVSDFTEIDLSKSNISLEQKRLLNIWLSYE